MLNVFIDSPRWFVRPNNTDWRHNQSLRGLERFAPLRCTYPDSHRDALVESIRYFSPRLGLKKPPLPALDSRLDGIDVVFSQRRDASAVPRPVAWQFAIQDPEMQMAAGVPADAIERAYDARAGAVQAASAIQVAGEETRRRHDARYGTPPGHFRTVPFFIPDLDPAAPSAVRAKHEADGTVGILFVGHQAGRKNLANLLSSLAALPQAERNRTRLCVVGELSDVNRADLAQPELRELVWERNLDRRGIAAAFAQSHVFAMPSKFETYGLVYVEAAAAGCAVIACNWESQREIFQDGACGLLVDPFRSITGQLQELIADRDRRLALGLAANARAASTYTPPAVAQDYLGMFEHAAGTRRAAGEAS